MADVEAISRSQADRLGERLRHGEMTSELIAELSRYRDQRVREAKDAAEAVRALTLYPVTPREGKSTGSIVAKLQRQPVALSRMQDIMGCRVVVDTIVEQDALTRRIAARFPDGRLVDRRVEPMYGYRAVHFIVRWQGQPYEIQVRTRLQHAWAQMVERLSDTRYPNLKYGEIEGTLSESIRGLSDVIANVEQLERENFSGHGGEDGGHDTARLGKLRGDLIELLEMVATWANL